MEEKINYWINNFICYY